LVWVESSIIVVNIISWIKKQQALQQGEGGDQSGQGTNEPDPSIDSATGRRLSPLEQAFKQLTQAVEPQQPKKPAKTIPHIKVRSKSHDRQTEKEKDYITAPRATHKPAKPSPPGKTISRNMWANGIIMSEVLRPPLAKRKGPRGMRYR